MGLVKWNGCEGFRWLGWLGLGVYLGCFVWILGFKGHDTEALECPAFHFGRIPIWCVVSELFIGDIDDVFLFFGRELLDCGGYGVTY